MAEGETSFSYLSDHLGSPIRLLGNNQEEILAYDEFGVPTVEAGTALHNPFGYTGYQRDDVSGLYYAQARNYQPAVGRFFAEDTARAGLNWYAYCNNNPIMFTDPAGLDAIIINRPVSNVLVRILAGEEHMSLLLQDKDGNWVYTSYMGDKMVYAEIIDNSVLFDMDKLNSYLREHEIVTDKERDFTRSTYVEGDFTAACTFSKDYSKDISKIQYNPNKFQSMADKIPNALGGVSGTDYSLFWNNCGHIAMDLFSMGITPDGQATYAEELRQLEMLYIAMKYESYPRHSPQFSFDLINIFFGFQLSNGCVYD